MMEHRSDAAAREGNKFGRRTYRPIAIVSFEMNFLYDARRARAGRRRRLRLRPAAAYKFVSICHAVVMNDDSA